MISNRGIWAGGVGLGFTAILAGIGIVADVAEQYDHRWGYGLIAVGMLLVALCGAVYLCITAGSENGGGGGGNRSRADRGGIAVSGSGQTVIQQSGGTIVIGGPPPAEIPAEPTRPKLTLSDPELTRDVPIYAITANGATLIDKVDLWRIRLGNATEGTKAVDVSVRLRFSDPELPLDLPLHRTGDDVWPYERRYSVRFDEDILLDLIAKSIESDAFYVWRSDQPSYADRLSNDDQLVIRRHLVRHAVVCSVKAIGDPPAEACNEQYLLVIDVDGRLTVEKSL